MDKVERWESRAEWPLTVVAVVFLASYAIPIIDPSIPVVARRLCSATVWATWAIFAADYVVRLVLSSTKGAFIRHNLLDLAVVALPILRPLRLLRLVALLSILNRTSARNLRGRVVAFATGGTLLLLLVGGLAITDAERGRPGANIENVGDGLWWAITTMTTVGYGDRFPVTSTGRFVAVALMVAGIALLGVITATFASWLVQRVSDTAEAEQVATRAQVDRLAEEVRALRAELSEPLRAREADAPWR